MTDEYDGARHRRRQKGLSCKVCSSVFPAPSASLATHVRMPVLSSRSPMWLLQELVDSKVKQQEAKTTRSKISRTHLGRTNPHAKEAQRSKTGAARARVQALSESLRSTMLRFFRRSAQAPPDERLSSADARAYRRLLPEGLRGLTPRRSSRPFLPSTSIRTAPSTPPSCARCSTPWGSPWPNSRSTASRRS